MTMTINKAHTNTQTELDCLQDTGWFMTRRLADKRTDRWKHAYRGGMQTVHTHTVMMGCHELPTKASTQCTVLLCLQLNMTKTTSTLEPVVIAPSVSRFLEFRHNVDSWKYINVSFSSPLTCCADNWIRRMFTGSLSNCCFNHGTTQKTLFFSIYILSILKQKPHYSRICFVIQLWVLVEADSAQSNFLHTLQPLLLYSQHESPAKPEHRTVQW